MPITLKKDVWKVKDPSSGQYRGAAILSTTLPQDAAQIISESNDTIQNIKDTAIEAVDTALNDESTGLIPKAEADRDAIDDSLNNATNGIIPTAQSDRDDIDDSLNNINDGIIPEAQANLATIAAAVQSQISQGTDKTLSVAKGFADAKAAGMMVKVSNYQPGSQLDDPATSQDASQNTGYPVYKDSNRVWVKETYAELEVPTMDDVDDLKSALSNKLKSESLDASMFAQGYITNSGDWDVRHPYSNICTTAIIDASTFSKIAVVMIGNERQACWVKYNKDSNAFIERSAWTSDNFVLNNEYSYRIAICTVECSDLTKDEVLSEAFVVIEAPVAELPGLIKTKDATVEAYPILVQGWNRATQKPQTYYASFYNANLFAGDVITVKDGFEIALQGYDRTIQVWTTDPVTITYSMIAKGPIDILFRRSGGTEELLLSNFGYALSNYINENYTSFDADQSAYHIYGNTLNLLKDDLDIPVSYKWKGKKVAFLGDSITYGVNTSKPYHTVLDELIGFSEKYVDGIAGSSVSSQASDSYIPMCQRASSIPTDCNLVIVFGGTNDFGHSTPLGTIDDETDVSFYGAVQLTIKTIIAANPDVRMAWMLPLHRIRGNYIGENEANSQGLKLIDYINALRLACEKWSIPVIDTYSTYGLNPAISQVYSTYITDGLHPNTAGHKLLAERIAPLLELL